MQASSKTQNSFTAIVRGNAPDAGSLRFPYAVYISGGLAGRFDDIRDALASARIAKYERPMAKIAVIDTATGKMVIEVEP
jgi:hypothetical protein